MAGDWGWCSALEDVSHVFPASKLGPHLGSRFNGMLLISPPKHQISLCSYHQRLFQGWRPWIPDCFPECSEMGCTLVGGALRTVWNAATGGCPLPFWVTSEEWAHRGAVAAQSSGHWWVSEQMAYHSFNQFLNGGLLVPVAVLNPSFLFNGAKCHSTPVVHQCLQGCGNKEWTRWTRLRLLLSLGSS